MPFLFSTFTKHSKTQWNKAFRALTPAPLIKSCIIKVYQNKSEKRRKKALKKTVDKKPNSRLIKVFG